MSKKLFSNKDIELLSKNKYVKKASENLKPPIYQYR